MTPEEKAAERERTIEAVVARTGKTREQAEAFFRLVGHSMGWRPRMDDGEFRTAFNKFLGDQEAP